LIVWYPRKMTARANLVPAGVTCGWGLKRIGVGDYTSVLAGCLGARGRQRLRVLNAMRRATRRGESAGLRIELVTPTHMMEGRAGPSDTDD